MACLSLAGCTFLTNGGIDKVLSNDAVADAGARNPVSIESVRARDSQAKFGAKQHPKILARYGGAYENESLELVLALIVGRLVEQSKNKDRAFDITILNSPTVNAFALPGGYLYVTRGLLALANDGAEVAAVLAHEMAHVSSNHGLDRSRKARAVDIANRVASDVVSNPVVSRVARASTEQRLAAFSKAQELQADAVGIKMLGEAGFDPYAASRMLIAMTRHSAWRTASKLGNEDEMSNSHPSTPQRVELARRHARAFGPQGSGDRMQDRYLRGLNGILFGDAEKEGFIRGRTYLHKKLGFRFAVPDGFELANRARAVLASGPGETAIRFDAVSKKDNGATPQAYVRSGWVNGLDESSVVPVSVNGLPAAQAVARSGDWQFRVTVVELKGRYYRFIVAAPRSTTGLDQISTQVSGSFRQLKASELSKLKPLKMKVVKLRRASSVQKMTEEMVGVARPKQLFLTLNGMARERGLRSGELVKIVTD